jgi:hypothetical protein
VDLLSDIVHLREGILRATSGFEQFFIDAEINLS